ncbi:serine hydrolase [Streptomyces sp. NPDC018000]|uniref:D-alanyl-D-alanine carboxypeptidase n=1 Tax=Streptomyces sp. NPDC018000 TaxID=3365028 RepID=UPI00379AE118
MTAEGLEKASEPTEGSERADAGRSAKGTDAAEPSEAVAAWVANDDDESAEGPKGGVKDDGTKDAESDADEAATAATENPEDAEDGTEKAAGAEDERGVDQPTAVFRAPTVDRVDHPTLRITPPASKSGPESKPESVAVRAGTFVPLRGDDVRPAPAPAPAPKPRKPETPIPAAASAATPGIPAALPPLPAVELTNTPPPPQAPVRTAARRVKIWTSLVLLLLIIFAIAQMVRPLPEPALVLSADPTYTFDGGKIDMPWPAEGQGAVEVEGVGTIGTYGAQKPAPIASVAKVMTAYVILEDHPLTGKEQGEKITADQQAEDESSREDESKAPMTKGQQFTQKQMLQLLMIPSGNNAARLLARWDATTEEAFVEKMNAAAKDLGMTNTTYTDPSGLKSSTVSTPTDQLKLAEAVMRNDVFREIVNMPQADIPGVGAIYNNNEILLEPGVSGIKTGSSTPAGGNLLWAADTVIDGKSRRIIGVVMGADLDGTLYAKLQRAIQNSLKLIKAAQKGVDSTTVVKKGDVVGYVDDGLGGRTPVVSTKDLKAIGWSGLQVKLDIGEGDEQVPHSAPSGTVVGEVTVGTGTGKVSAPIALQKDLSEPGFGPRLTRVS